MGLGPRPIAMTPAYRIEEFVWGSDLSNLEMRHPFVYRKLARMLCDFHHSTRIQDRVLEITNGNRKFFL